MPFAAQPVVRADLSQTAAPGRSTLSLTGDLPCEVLRRLPVWCVYVETPGRQWFGQAMHRFFAHLECDANTGREELRMLIDADDGLVPV